MCQQPAYQTHRPIWQSLEVMRRNLYVAELGLRKGQIWMQVLQITIWHCSSTCTGSEAAWCWFMALLHEPDERFTTYFALERSLVLRKFVILGHRAEGTFATSMEQGLTPVPETPPGCQMNLFLGGESQKASETQRHLTSLWFGSRNVNPEICFWRTFKNSLNFL